jgi:large subunit ribosomal protein L35
MLRSVSRRALRNNKILGSTSAIAALVRGIRSYIREILINPESNMPKLKTNRGAVKRFRVTGKGKVKYRKANRNHILTKKSSKRKGHLRSKNDAYVNASDLKGIKRILNVT